MPWAMHEMRTPYDRPVNDDDLSHDRPLIHDPAFHHWLNHTVNHCSLHDRLHDFSLDNPALNNRTYDVTLDKPALHARRFVVFINLNAAPSGSMVKHIIIIVQRIASTELRSGRSGCEHGSGRIGECGHAADGKCLHKRFEHCGLRVMCCSSDTASPPNTT
jgi:hypothetical protein